MDSNNCTLLNVKVPSVISDSLQPYGPWPARLMCPGKNIGVGCHALLQGNLPDPGMEPVSLTSPALASGSLPLGPPGKPKYLV